jgi:hypothetical protein
MIPLDDAAGVSRIARLDRLIEQYRFAKKRRLVREAMSLWRKIQAHQKLLDFEKSDDRVH